MPVFASDTFTDTSGTNLTAHTPEVGSAWVKTNGATGDAMISDANRARINSTTTAIYRQPTTPPSADYSVEATLVVKSYGGGITWNAGLYGRAPGDGTNSCYRFFFTNPSGGGAGTFTLGKIVTGTATVLDTDTSFTLVDESSYVLRLEMIGSTIKGYLDGVEICSATDSAVSAAGFAAVYFGSTSAVSLNGNTGHLDNFSASTPTPSPSRLLLGAGA